MKTYLYKALINWRQAADKPLPSWLRKACASNPELQAELEEGEALTRSLKRPPEPAAAFEENLTARVMRQITEEDYAAERQERDGVAWMGWLGSAGAIAAALALAVFGITQFGPERQDTAGAKAPPVAAAVEAGVETLDGAEIELRKLGQQWENPLDQEIEYVLSDARGAIGFLANNFVPSSYLKKSERGAGEGNNA